jgi:hypothetical protein
MTIRLVSLYVILWFNFQKKHLWPLITDPKGNKFTCLIFGKTFNEAFLASDYCPSGQ